MGFYIDQLLIDKVRKRLDKAGSFANADETQGVMVSKKIYTIAQLEILNMFLTHTRGSIVGNDKINDLGRTCMAFIFCYRIYNT